MNEKPAFIDNVKQGEIGRALYYETPPKKRLVRFVDYTLADKFIAELQFPYIQVWPSFRNGYPYVTYSHNPLTREEPLYSLPLPHIESGLLCIKGANYNDSKKQLDKFWKETFILNYSRGRYKKEHITKWEKTGRMPPGRLLKIDVVIYNVLLEQG